MKHLPGDVKIAVSSTKYAFVCRYPSQIPNTYTNPQHPATKWRPACRVVLSHEKSSQFIKRDVKDNRSADWKINRAIMLRCAVAWVEELQTKMMQGLSDCGKAQRLKEERQWGSSGQHFWRPGVKSTMTFAFPWASILETKLLTREGSSTCAIRGGQNNGSRG